MLHENLIGHGNFSFSDGTCIPANSTLEEIHEVFGKSWKVQSEYDWLFSQMFALRIENDIQNDMPFEPNYQPIFRSHEEENQAKQVSVVFYDKVTMKGKELKM